MTQIYSKPYLARFTSEGVVSGATHMSLCNVGSANAFIRGVPLLPGEKVVLEAGRGDFLEDVIFDARNTILLVSSVNGQPLVKNLPPSISITAPLPNTTYTLGQPISIAASASDADGIIKFVTFKVNGVVVGRVTTVPYTVNWFPRYAGTYFLSAIATDDKDAITECSDVRVQLIS